MKKLLNRQIAIVAVAVIATVAFFSFKSGDDRNFQIAKNLDIFNAIVKESNCGYHRYCNNSYLPVQQFFHTSFNLNES